MRAITPLAPLTARRQAPGRPAATVSRRAPWPTWPYTYERGVYRRGGHWRYAPSGAAAAIAALIVILFWLGLLVIAWPWAATPVR